jgi:hypothetical protein
MVCVAVAAAAVALALAGCGATDNAELKRRVEALNAIAVEGGLLADGVIGDRTKATFTRVHARALGEEADHEAEKVADAKVAAGLRREREQTVALAQRLGDALGILQTFPGGERTARVARRRLADVADAAGRLDAGIPEASP